MTKLQFFTGQKTNHRIQPSMKVHSIHTLYRKWFYWFFTYIPTMFDQAKLNCNLSRRSVEFVLLKKSFYNLYDIVLLDTTLSLIKSTQWAKIEEFPNNNM